MLVGWVVRMKGGEELGHCQKQQGGDGRDELGVGTVPS